MIPRFITQALDGEALTIHGDGHASRDWLWVDDHAEALEALIDVPLERVAGEVVNIATGLDISVAEIADLVIEAVGNPEATVVSVGERPGQVDQHLGSTDKMERLTGWRARTSFADGLERTVAWYRENEAWWRETSPARRPRLLVLGAGPAQLGLLEAARSRGLHVIAADRDPQAVGFAARGRACRRSRPTTSPRSSGSRGRETIDGVISPGADWTVGVAARIADRVGLPHPIDLATADPGDVEGAAARAVLRRPVCRSRGASLPGEEPHVSVRRQAGRPARPARAVGRPRPRRPGRRRWRPRRRRRVAAAT